MTIVSHMFNGGVFCQLTEDTQIGTKLIPKGYVNLTAMCKSQGKKLAQYNRLASSKPYWEALSAEVHIPTSVLMIEVEGSGKGNDQTVQGTWGHVQIAIDVAQWISPQFRVWANRVLLHIINDEYQALTPEAEIAKRRVQQIWEEVRAAGIGTRRTFTDAIRDYILEHPYLSDDYRIYIYPRVSDCLNLGVFGKTAAALCLERSCDYNHLRDTHEAKDLKLIDRIEHHCVKLIDKYKMEPLLAMRESIAFEIY